MIETYLAWIEEEIRKQEFGKRPRSLYDPLRYIMKLGGKRIRPLLTLLSYSLFKSDVRPAVPFAVAMEVFHNFTLLHDDIMDKAPLRRGSKTVHEKWNVNTAILAGDVMQIKVYEMLLSVPAGKLRPILEAFNRCAVEVCEGQQSDMEFENKPTVSEAEYIEMIRQKTAVLLGFCLELGAILGDASINEQVALRDFGVNIGIGFQLKDDLLDVYADKKKFGKRVGGDIIANKKTFLLIKALEIAKREKRKDLTNWMKKQRFDANKKVAAVTAIYDSLGIRSLAERKSEFFFDQAYSKLNAVSSPRKKDLIELTGGLLRREV